MAQKRSTFSEHWYRVADLRVRLIPAVRTHKQYFRDKSWHVLQSPLNQEFFRLDEAGYGFLGLLNGQRTVSEAWNLANERFGDDAPTQGEAIQLLGRLFLSNLLQGDLPPDAENLFGRFHKRRKREIQTAATGFLFPRFRLWDPDSFLNRWVGLAGWLFTWKGMALWFVLVLLGAHALAGRGDELFNYSEGVLSPSNLPLLYLAFVVSKLVHELAHGFACKALGMQEGDAGQVHDMGIMLLILTPAPYVDATASWAFRNKWRRIMVGAAGMWAELALASAAAMVWASTGVGNAAHAVAYNLMFVASVSTILFNGNPLLRYDAYYMLCDLLEMPNLSTRAQQYVYYLVKRYVWGVKTASHSADGVGERLFFFIYCLASNIYRIFLLAGILLTISSLAYFIGAVLALLSLGMWVLMPLFKLLRYLLTSAELGRVRLRAVATTFVVLGGACAAVAMVPAPDRFRIEGVAESDGDMGVHAASSGFLRSALDSNSEVAGGKTVVAVLENPGLESQRESLQAREKEIIARQRLAEATDPSEAQAMRELLGAVREELARVEHLRRELSVRAERDGVWIAPRLDSFLGAYVEQGQKLGEILTLDNIHIRSFPGQLEGVNLITEALPEVELRVKGRPDLRASGVIRQILPAASKELPTPALGFPAGGETPVDEEDPHGATSAEHVFEIKIDIRDDGGWRLLPGQVVVIRFSTPEKTILEQAWRGLRQLLQRRFHV